MDMEFKFNIIFDDKGKDLQKLIDELLLEIYKSAMLVNSF